MIILEKVGKSLKINERFLLVRQHFKLTKEAFGELAGVSGTTIGNIESGITKNPGADLLGVISMKLGVNPGWLLTGLGEMLQSDADSKKTLPHIAPNNAHAVGLLSDIPVIELRRVSFKARASFVELGGADTSSGIFDQVLHRLAPGKTEADYADALVFDIEGDSMEPSLQSGQQVIAWPVPEAKWEYLHNTVCVVAYEDTVTVKAIVENELFTHNRLTLRATGGGGGSFVVARQAIHSIWEVRELYGIVRYRFYV